MTFRATLIKRTPNAMLVQYEGRDIWLPRSQIEAFTPLEPGKAESEPQQAEFKIPSWLAAAKGIEE